MSKCLVIYYDESQCKAKLLEPMGAVYDSSQPHIWGLPADFMVVAVIVPVGDTVNDPDFDITSHLVYIDEECISIDEMRKPPTLSSPTDDETAADKALWNDIEGHAI